MKVTLNWLKQYVDFPWSPAELAERLTMLGLEVEGVEKLGGEFEGIVVAQVITRDKHPNADKLSLCRVQDGQGERQIVCGAQNFQAGDKVPLILPGASLPLKPGETQPFTIKVGKIRGVESHGMLCSPQELGLPDQVDGLLILRGDAQVGQPFAEYLGRAGSDVVYDLEVTPNRPDLNSVIGIAREIAAVTGNPLRIPSSAPVESSTSKAVEQVAVRLEGSDLCPRYTARVVRGVKVGPSPEWLRSTLQKVGIRSISNVVDVTNYVMLECGQPLHAFDYHLIGKGAEGKPTIVVRRAAEGEKFVTLDGQERALAPDTLLIADEQKGIALAGVMGGQNTEINDRTVDVLIESAWFQPTNIRRTSKQLGLRTESSYRFERGADIGIADWASQRCAQLILETAGGELARGVVDVIARDAGAEDTAHILEADWVAKHSTEDFPDSRFVAMRPAQACFQLDGAVALYEISPILEQRGVKNVGSSLGSLGLKSRGDLARDWDVFAVPNQSQDLRSEQDLVREIAASRGIPYPLPLPTAPKFIVLRFSKTDALLGFPIEPAVQVRLLGALGLKVAARSNEFCTFRIPTWRVDLKRETDLIEEVERLHGLDKVPATPPRGAIGSHPYDAIHDQIAEARRLLCSLGLNEAQGQTLISEHAARIWSTGAPVLLANPLSSDMGALRPSLLPGLLDSLRHNLSRQNHDVALFEIGRVFTDASGAPKEERRLAIALTGQRQPSFWRGAERDARFDLSDLKGFVEEFLEQFGVRAAQVVRRSEAAGPWLESAVISLGGRVPLGEMGQLSPLLAKQFDLRDAVLLAELNLDELLPRRTATRSFKPLPAYPCSQRDLALLVPESVTHEAVLSAIRQAKPGNLENVELFDVFRGKHVPEGQKSMAYSLTYRSPERTLTDAEVNAAQEKVVADLKQKLGAVLRDF